MLAPQVGHVRNQSGSRWAIVVETGHTTINFEGGGVEHAATEHGVEHGPVNGLAGLGVDGGHLGGSFRRLRGRCVGPKLRPKERRRGKKRAGGNRRRGN